MKVYFPLALFTWAALEVDKERSPNFVPIDFNGPEGSVGFLPVYPDLQTLFAAHGKNCKFGILTVIEAAHTDDELQKLDDLKEEVQTNYMLAKSFRIPHRKETPKLLRESYENRAIEHKKNQLEHNGD